MLPKSGELLPTTISPDLQDSKEDPFSVAVTVEPRIGADPVRREDSRGFRNLGMVFRIFSDQDFENPFLSQTLKGLHKVAAESGFTIGFCPIEEGEDFFEHCRAKNLDAAIYMTYRHRTDHAALLKFRDRGIPAVIFGRELSLPSVDMDYQGGVDRVVRELVRRGRHRIAYVGGGLDQDFNQEKFRGFLKSLVRYGLTEDPGLIFHDCWRQEDGERIVQKLTDESAVFDALFVADGDFAAVGALSRLQALGWKVPEEISVVAGDGSAYVRITRPVLASLESPYAARAAAAVRMLSDWIRTGNRPGSELIPMGFFPGESLW